MKYRGVLLLKTVLPFATIVCILAGVLFGYLLSVGGWMISVVALFGWIVISRHDDQRDGYPLPWWKLIVSLGALALSLVVYFVTFIIHIFNP